MEQNSQPHSNSQRLSATINVLLGGLNLSGSHPAICVKASTSFMCSNIIYILYLKNQKSCSVLTSFWILDWKHESSASPSSFLLEVVFRFLDPSGPCSCWYCTLDQNWLISFSLILVFICSLLSPRGSSVCPKRLSLNLNSSWTSAAHWITITSWGAWIFKLCLVCV